MAEVYFQQTPAQLHAIGSLTLYTLDDGSIIENEM